MNEGMGVGTAGAGVGYGEGICDGRGVGECVGYDWHFSSQTSVGTAVGVDVDGSGVGRGVDGRGEGGCVDSVGKWEG